MYVESDMFHKLICSKLDVLALDHAFLKRSLYEGFSGGEKKRLELLQMLLFEPKIAVLDEVDSGVDRDSLTIIGDALLQARQMHSNMSFIIITHYPQMVSRLKPDYVHVMNKGYIIQSGSMMLAHKIKQDGYRAITR